MVMGQKDLNEFEYFDENHKISESNKEKTILYDISPFEDKILNNEVFVDLLIIDLPVF
jgi:hypothetical protein